MNERTLRILGTLILACAVIDSSDALAQSGTPFLQKACTTDVAPEAIYESKFDCRHYDLPAVGIYSEAASKRFHRSEFVRWLMQQASYGNVAVAKDLLPEFIHVAQISPDDEDEAKMAVRRFRWLILEEGRLNDSATQVLSCTLKSIQNDIDDNLEDIKANLDDIETNPDDPHDIKAIKQIRRELKFLGTYVDAEADHVVPMADFWISYDLVVDQAQQVLADTRAGLATSGRLGLDADGQRALQADLEDGRCAMVPMLNQSAKTIVDLPLADTQKAIVSDAADLAKQLWTAVDNELGFELEMVQNPEPSSDEEPESMIDAVNHQLHCETIPPIPADKDDEQDPCNGLSGAIHSAVLAPASALRTAFDSLDDSISRSAREINLLNADLMKADRNLRTYSEVFADFSKEQMVKDALRAENTLHAILREREFLAPSEGEQFWVPIAGTDFVEYSSESVIHNDCIEDEDCDFCSIDKPLSRDNLETYLICFHVQGMKSASYAYSAIEGGSGAVVGSNPLFTDTCDPLGIFSGKAIGLEEEELQEKKDQAVTNCFIDWVWDYHPAAALSFEASMQ